MTQSNAGVETLHPEYIAAQQEWKLIRALNAGQKNVKKLKTDILPPPDLGKDGAYDKQRYQLYLTRAVYTNVVGATKAGLVGAATRKEANVELPDQLDYLIDNANGSGEPLNQAIKISIGQNIEVGREILFVDYPDLGIENPTQEDVNLLEPRAYINTYKAEDLTNWRLTRINNQMVLTLAVLREEIDIDVEEFGHEPEYQYRVLRLDESGYSYQLYKQVTRDSSGGIFEPQSDEPIYPTQSTGERFDRIPIVVIGSESNDSHVDKIPLIDIGYQNIGHYINSADLEENASIHGQLTMGITTNLDDQTWNKMNPDGVQVGARRGIFLGENGSLIGLQAEPNQLSDKLMERKEEQMVYLGAKIIDSRTTVETATQARMNKAGENSVLSDIVQNVEDAYRKAIDWCGLFMGVETESVVLELNKEFFPDDIDPQLIMAAIQLRDRGVISLDDIRDLSRKARLTDRSNEEIDELVEDDSPIGEVIEEPVNVE